VLSLDALVQLQALQRCDENGASAAKKPAMPGSTTRPLFRLTFWLGRCYLGGAV